VKKKEITDNTTLVKQDISKAFEEIRLKLVKKEKEILERTEITLQENLQELNTFSRVINSKIVSLTKLLDSVNTNIVRKDEVSLLNFYAENVNKIVQTTETQIPDIPPLDVIQNLNVNINQESVAGMINGLNGIHLEITSMKGVNISKVPKTQKIRRDIYGNINHIINKEGVGVDNLSAYDMSRPNLVSLIY
jgi:hypothetical protein